MITKKYYVLVIHGDVDPEIQGPYKSAGRRDHRAKQLSSQLSSTFWLNVNQNGHTNRLQVGAYAGGFLKGLPGVPGSEQ